MIIFDKRLPSFNSNEEEKKLRKFWVKWKVGGLFYRGQENYCMKQIKQGVNNTTSHTLTQLD